MCQMNFEKDTKYQKEKIDLIFRSSRYKFTYMNISHHFSSPNVFERKIDKNLRKISSTKTLSTLLHMRSNIESSSRFSDNCSSCFSDELSTSVLQASILKCDESLRYICVPLHCHQFWIVLILTLIWNVMNHCESILSAFASFENSLIIAISCVCYFC